MKKILVFLLALIVQPAFAVTVIQKNVQVPTTGTLTPFDFANDGTNSWPFMQLFDGTNLGVINPNGQASLNGGQPVTLPAVQVTADLCTLLRKTSIPISTAAGNFQLVGPVALNQVYICSIFIQPAANATISLIGGTGATCATGTPAAIAGSTTLANGIPIVTSNGFAPGNGGATIMSTTTAGHGVCLEQTGTVQLSGYMTYIQSLL